jgi:hypothetical protein
LSIFAAFESVVLVILFLLVIQLLARDCGSLDASRMAQECPLERAVEISFCPRVSSRYCPSRGDTQG